MNYPDPVPLTRRSALTLLAVSGLSGCTFTPIKWEQGEAAPSATGKGDGAVEIRPDYFAQSPDSGARTLSEGVPSPQRISTPHFDARLDRRFAGESLGAVTAAQVRERGGIRAPEGHDLLAFTLEAGTPTFAETDESRARIDIQVGDGLSYPVKAPFGLFSSERGTYDRAWALFVFAVPTGSPVALNVTDEGKKVSVDLRTGAPVVDDAWHATRGFRERVDIEVVGGQQVIERDLTTAPVNGQNLASRFRLGLDPDAGYGLVPWNPEGGWAPEGRQWLRVAMRARVEFVPSEPNVVIDLDVPRSFVYTEAMEAPIGAHLPKTITTESIQRGSGTLDVTWVVPGAAAEARFVCNPVGVAVARFSDHPDVPVEFTGAAEQAQYTLKFTPREE